MPLFALLAFAADPPWAWPAPSQSIHERFAPPAQDWHPGHRGIDIEARPGQQARAVAAGRVVFAGLIAGTGTVSIDHGGVRSTYQPVTALVTEGDDVEAGEAIGVVQAGHEGCATGCLHLGAKTADGYLDPLRLLNRPRIVLKPTGRAVRPWGGPG